MTSSTKDIYVKQNLGKFSLFLLWGCALLYGEDFTYDFHTDIQNPYCKQDVILSIDVNQTNPKHVLFFQVAIDKSEDYTAEQISSTQDHTLHHIKIHSLYLIHPLKSGDVNLTFGFRKRLTDDAKVKYFSSGDRDDFKKLETIDSQIDVPPITLKVKPLPKNTKLVGDYTLDYSIQKHQAKSFEPIAVNIVIKGKGYPPLLGDLLPKSDNYTRFIHAPKITKKIDSTGVYYTATYALAVTAQKDFILKAVEIPAFNPKTGQHYMLKIPAQEFNITKVNQSTLVDTIDDPKSMEISYAWIKDFLRYLLIFMAGYLSAFILKWRKKPQAKALHPLIKKIKETSDSKTLLQLLMATDASTFSPLIAQLENALYAEEKININQIKKEAIDLI